MKIVVANVTAGPPFAETVGDLADLLRTFLPVTVSFAHCTLAPTTLPADVVGDAWPAEWTAHVIGQVDRALFGAKRARRDDGADIPLGFVIPA